MSANQNFTSNFQQEDQDTQKCSCELHILTDEPQRSSLQKERPVLVYGSGYSIHPGGEGMVAIGALSAVGLVHTSVGLVHTSVAGTGGGCHLPGSPVARFS